MNKSVSYGKVEQKSLLSAGEITKMALVAALYVAVTAMLSVISFGPVQLRIAEMFNYLALYNKRYIVAITGGVVIVNFMSPTWMLDVLIGGTATFLVLLLCRLVTKRIKNEVLKMVITALIFSFSMFTVAGQLAFVFDLPFFYTWLTVGIGELFSMSLGGVIIYFLHQKIDFSK